MPDPLGEKYYDVSPYAYCAGNPVNLVDPEGEKIYYADGVSKEFKQQFAATVKYMNTRGTAGNLAKLEASDVIYYISEVNNIKSVRFSATDNNTIYWDPTHLYGTSSGLWLSPATALDHEATHALRHDDEATGKMTKEDIKAFKQGLHYGTDSQYGTREERYIITEREQKTARKHHEIVDGQITRTDHIIMTVGGDLIGKTPDEIEKIIIEHNILLLP